MSVIVLSVNANFLNRACLQHGGLPESPKTPRIEYDSEMVLLHASWAWHAQECASKASLL